MIRTAADVDTLVSTWPELPEPVARQVSLALWPKTATAQPLVEEPGRRAGLNTAKRSPVDHSGTGALAAQVTS